MDQHVLHDLSRRMLVNTLFILLNLSTWMFANIPFEFPLQSGQQKSLANQSKIKWRGPTYIGWKLAHRSWPTPNSIFPPKISQQTPSPNNKNKMKGTNIYSMILAEECWPTPFLSFWTLLVNRTNLRTWMFANTPFEFPLQSGQQKSLANQSEIQWRRPTYIGWY